MPPVTNYNIFTLSTESVVGISTTATVATSTSAVSYIAASTSAAAYPLLAPSSSNILGNTLSGVTSATTLLALPANRVWQGSISINGVALGNSTSVSNAFYTVIPATSATTITPASTNLLQLCLNGPAVLLAGTTDVILAGTVVQNFTIAVGSSSTFLAYTPTGGAISSLNSVTANGILL